MLQNLPFTPALSVETGAKTYDIEWRTRAALQHAQTSLSPLHCLSTGADTLLGPEMRSTGEVMGIDRDFSSAYAKAAMAAGQRLPTSGNVFITMTDKCKPDIVPVAKQLSDLGFGIYATEVGVLPSWLTCVP